MENRQFKQSNTHLKPGDPPLIKFWKISKFFPGLIANNQIEMDIFPGEIHAVIGENGAGKSTLMNILNGLSQPDEGEIIIDGYGCPISSPQEAITLGIGMVHQHFKLVQPFTIIENIYLTQKSRSVFLSLKTLKQHIVNLAKQFGFNLDPDMIIRDLSIGQQQQVEILKALFQHPRILVLDEPTAILTPQEIESLFIFLSEFRQNGNAVIFTSHKLDEVMRFSDTVSILRKGKKIATYKTSNCHPALLIKTMMGNNFVLSLPSKEQSIPASASPFLHLSNISAKNQHGLLTLHDITLTIYPREILGIAGITGNGQRELSQIVTGILKPTSGHILLKNKKVTTKNPKHFLKAGIGHITEERLHTALSPHLNIYQNLMMRHYRQAPVGNGFFFSHHHAYQKALQLVRNSQTHIHKLSDQITTLSGGTQQKLVIFREVEIATSLLVAVYPTRGLDIGSTQRLHRYFLQLREKNISTLLFSEDLDELLTLSDRIGVLCQGTLMGIVATEKTDKETLGMMMGGCPLSRIPFKRT